jgi:hypothetical protein
MDLELRVFELLCETSLEPFGIDLPAETAGRNHENWALGVDSERKCYRDLRGNIDPTTMKIFDGKFFVQDAGYQVSVQEKLQIGKNKADVFFDQY